MEPPPQTYVPNQQVLAAELNDLCTRAVGFQPADQNNFYATGALLLPDGLSALEWMTVSLVIPNGVLFIIDSSLDFRDRVITSHYCTGDSDAEKPGSADDYLFDYVVTVRKGYTGRGAYQSGGVLAPSAGNPPVPASAVSWAMTVSSGVYLYAHPTTGALYIYNDSGVSLYATQLTLYFTPPTGRRP